MLRLLSYQQNRMDVIVPPVPYSSASNLFSPCISAQLDVSVTRFFSVLFDLLLIVCLVLF